MSEVNVNTLQSQLQSARKAVLFMETEHAKTLHGLHNEIKKLQKRCNELTLEIVVKEDEAYSREAKTKIKSMENDAANSAQEKVELFQQLEEKDKRIFELEQKYKTQDISYTNELKAKGHQVTSLANELDVRATTIAYLTTQLHQAHSKIHLMQQKHKQQQAETARKQQEESSPSAAAVTTTTSPRAHHHHHHHHHHHRFTPTPPPPLIAAAASSSTSEGRPRSGHRHHHHHHHQQQQPQRRKLLGGEGNLRPVSPVHRELIDDDVDDVVLVKQRHHHHHRHHTLPVDPSPFVDGKQPKGARKSSSGSRRILPPINHPKQSSSSSLTTEQRRRRHRHDADEDDLLEEQRLLVTTTDEVNLLAPRRIKSTTQQSASEVAIGKMCATGGEHQRHHHKRHVHKT